MALAKAGIVFIGPNPKAIAAMGDKIESKKAAAAAKVSTVPGHLGVIEDDEAGGQDRRRDRLSGDDQGLRRRRRQGHAHRPFRKPRSRKASPRSKSEAKSSFGDDRMFIEKFIVNPRHIEIQVLGDKHGNVIYLGERECSIQRRNQKVIEEAPSPLLDEATRKKMGEQAVALAKAVGYDSAGTVEFVAGQDKSFYFLEMNTRLQVEHPVTELDHRHRSGRADDPRRRRREARRSRRSDVKLNGWAVESRVYAEDPYRNFLPSTGRLTRYRPPAEASLDGVTVRNDTGVYRRRRDLDPLRSDDRQARHPCADARRRRSTRRPNALDAFVIDGIRHNIPFLVGADGSIRAGRPGKLSTGFIAEEFPEGFHADRAGGRDGRDASPRSPPRSTTCWASASAASPAR